MAELHLIVSNPPHRDPDVAALAPLLQCAAPEARMRVNFPAPDIWLAEAVPDSARQKAQALVEAGVNVAWIPGSVLAAVSGGAMGVATTLREEGLLFTTPGGEVWVAKGDQVVAVVGEPVQQEGRPASDQRSLLTQKVQARGPVRNVPIAGGTASGAVGGAGTNAVGGPDEIAPDARSSAEKRLSEVRSLDAFELFLDVYAMGAEGWKVVRISPSSTDFSGLGAAKQPMARANIGAIVDLLEKDYGARVDQRLMKVIYRPSVVSGLALSQVLRSISERLAGLALLDIGSRLAFLTSKGKPR